MSTSDPASAERSMPASTETSYELTGDRLSAAMASLPDPAVDRPAGQRVLRSAAQCGRERPRSCHHRRCARSLAGCSDSPECHQSSRSNTLAFNIRIRRIRTFQLPEFRDRVCKRTRRHSPQRLPTQHHHLKFLALPATFWIELRRSTRLRHFRH